MMASAGTRPTTPSAASEVVISPVAVLDCSSAVKPNPVANALKRLPSALPRKRRRSGPNARNTPLSTMCRPHNSSATPPRRSRRTRLPIALSGSDQLLHVRALSPSKLHAHVRSRTDKDKRASAAESSLSSPQPSHDALRKKRDDQHEQDAQPQQPAIGMKQGRHQRHAGQRATDRVEAVLQIILSQHDDDGANDGAIERAHAADHDHQ